MRDLTIVESLFFAAQEKQAGPERAAFLDEVCGEDYELRRHIECLLTAHFQTSDILDKPAHWLVEAAEERAPSERPGSIIGPYKLMEQIGAGGMGLVFVADQQHPVRRRIAPPSSGVGAGAGPCGPREESRIGGGSTPIRVGSWG